MRAIGSWNAPFEEIVMGLKNLSILYTIIQMYIYSTLYILCSMHLEGPVNLPMPHLRSCLVRHSHIRLGHLDFLEELQ